MSIDLDFFGLTKEVARPIAHSLSTNKRGGDCWGWPRLVRVSVSSANTCPPPKAAAYSASATDATTMGMRWQKAWRGALWVMGVVLKRRGGTVRGGRHEQGTVCLSYFVCDFLWAG